jgi:hypothetical protein
VRGGEEESCHEGKDDLPRKPVTPNQEAKALEELAMLFRPVAGQVPVGKVSGGRREISDLLLGQICYLVGVDIDRRPTRTRLVRAVSTDGVLG